MGLMRNVVGAALREARRAAMEVVERKTGGSSRDATSRTRADTPRAIWQRAGLEPARRWESTASLIEMRWRGQEELARAAGGELLSGIWLASGEQVAECWRQIGRSLFRRWEQWGAGGPAAAPEGALHEVHRELEPVWRDARDRIMELLEREGSRSEALRRELEPAFDRGASSLEAAWRSSEPLAASIRRTLEQLDSPVTSGNSAELEAGWVRVSDTLEQAWTQVLSAFEEALRRGAEEG